jgi:GMP synthase-like glutamine amidotransferase
MILLINNQTFSADPPPKNPELSSAAVSGCLNLKRALRVLGMPFYEVSCYGISHEVLDPKGKIFKSITGVIISGSLMKLSTLVNDISKYVHVLHYLQAFPHVPIFGLCFGAQLLVVLYGGFIFDNLEYTCKMAPVEVLANHKLFRLNDPRSKKSIKAKRRISKRATTQAPSNKRVLIDGKFCFSDIPIVTNRHVKPIAWVRGNTSTLPVAFEFERGRVYGSMFHPEHSENTYYIFKNIFSR